MRRKTDTTLLEQQVMEYLLKCTANGYVPSVREMCAKLNMRSIATTYNVILELEKKGLIARDPGKNRNIRLLNTSNSAYVPLVGNVAAGAPILATENIEAYIPIDRGDVDAAELFALKVKGDSMIKAGILNGDVIIVRKATSANNGDIVVALIDDEATVKRYYKENGRFILKPENDSLVPYETDELTLLGKIYMVIRKY